MPLTFTQTFNTRQQHDGLNVLNIEIPTEQIQLTNNIDVNSNTRGINNIMNTYETLVD